MTSTSVLCCRLVSLQVCTEKPINVSLFKTNLIRIYVLTELISNMMYFIFNKQLV